MIFPRIVTPHDVIRLIAELRLCETVFMEDHGVFEGVRCLGFRVKVGNLASWVTGFGPFSFLPVTRQAPFTEIAFRVKPRPNCEYVMKKAPEGVMHLADLDMLGLSHATLLIVRHLVIKSEYGHGDPQLTIGVFRPDLSLTRDDAVDGIDELERIRAAHVHRAMTGTESLHVSRAL